MDRNRIVFSILERNGKNWTIFLHVGVVLLALAICSCGSRRLEVRGEMEEVGMVEEKERTVETGGMTVDVGSVVDMLREVEWMMRRVEERDSAGNERVTTDVTARLREREKEEEATRVEARDTTRTARETGSETRRNTTMEGEEEKVSAAREWKWITWGIVALVVAVVVGRVVWRRGKK